MNIATYKSAVKTWVEAQSGLPAQWRDEQGGWHQKTRALLHFHTTTAVGVDHIRWNQDTELEAGVDFVPTFSGNREITLSIFVESRNQSGSNVASYYLEKLRTSLQKPSVKSALYTAGLAFATAEAVVDLSNWVDDRVESKASLDIHFNAAENETDTDEVDSFVETAVVSAEITNPSDDDVGWTDEEMP